MGDESDLDVTASPADVQEQRRPLIEEGFDPERTAEGRAPDALSTEADAADVHDQTTEVVGDEHDEATGGDDDDPYGESLVADAYDEDPGP